MAGVSRGPRFRKAFYCSLIRGRVLGAFQGMRIDGGIGIALTHGWPEAGKYLRLPCVCGIFSNCDHVFRRRSCEDPLVNANLAGD